MLDHHRGRSTTTWTPPPAVALRRCSGGRWSEKWEKRRKLRRECGWLSTTPAGRAPPTVRRRPRRRSGGDSAAGGRKRWKNVGKIKKKSGANKNVRTRCGNVAGSRSPPAALRRRSEIWMRGRRGAFERRPSPTRCWCKVSRPCDGDRLLHGFRPGFVGGGGRLDMSRSIFGVAFEVPTGHRTFSEPSSDHRPIGGGRPVILVRSRHPSSRVAWVSIDSQRGISS